MVKRLFFVGAIVSITIPVQAGFTGLNFVPIADLLRHREGLAQYLVAGTDPKIDKKYGHANALTIGLFDRVEIGYDNDFLGETVYNAKALLIENSKGLKNFSLSAGISNWKGRQSDPYVVGSYAFEKFNLHGGWWRQGNVSTGFAGFDFELFPGCAAMAEHVTSRIGATWIGFSWEIPKVDGLAFGAGYGFANERGAGDQHYATLTYGFRF